jgi:hypothetical protein
MSRWRLLDRAVQRDIERARETGDPEKIREAQQRANETYAVGAGTTIGSMVGSLIAPGIGTFIGGVVGGILGNEAAKD